jgi:hypothetical protein
MTGVRPSCWPLLLCGLLAGIGPLLGCSSKEILYPEDHERYKRIDSAMETLRTGYEEKDLSRLKGLMLPLGSMDRIEQEIQKDFDSFEQITLGFSVERIVIEGDNVDAFVHWHGHWKRTKTDTGVRERGHGVLHWVGVQSILLKGMDGDLPFGMTARLAAAESQRPDAQQAPFERPGSQKGGPRK